MSRATSVDHYNEREMRLRVDKALTVVKMVLDVTRRPAYVSRLRVLTIPARQHSAMCTHR